MDEYKRGLTDAINIVCRRINQILDGADDGQGSSPEPWESTRRRLLELVGETR
jgi:hypothetical protein